jgi:hypothetical protein
MITRVFGGSTASSPKAQRSYSDLTAERHDADMVVGDLRHLLPSWELHLRALNRSPRTKENAKCREAKVPFYMGKREHGRGISCPASVPKTTKDSNEQHGQAKATSDATSTPGSRGLPTASIGSQQAPSLVCRSGPSGPYDPPVQGWRPPAPLMPPHAPAKSFHG